MCDDEYWWLLMLLEAADDCLWLLSAVGGSGWLYSVSRSWPMGFAWSSYVALGEVASVYNGLFPKKQLRARKVRKGGRDKAKQ